MHFNNPVAKNHVMYNDGTILYIMMELSFSSYCSGMNKNKFISSVLQRSFCIHSDSDQPGLPPLETRYRKISSIDKLHRLVPRRPLPPKLASLHHRTYSWSLLATIPFPTNCLSAHTHQNQSLLRLSIHPYALNTSILTTVIADWNPSRVPYLSKTLLKHSSLVKT